MTHAQSQLYDRTLGTDLRPDILHRMALRKAKEYSGRDIAVLLAVMPERHICKSDHRDGLSNGNQLWAICRHGQFVTSMLRRTDQPATAKALRVDLVCIA